MNVFPRILRIAASLVFSSFAVVSAAAAIAPGETLISQMNCVACHDAAVQTKQRLASPQAPHLGADGVRATPQWLRKFLADPQAELPGTLMPDVLHSLTPVQKQNDIEALTHYLVSLQKPDGGLANAPNGDTIALGEKLYHTIGCVACHAAQKAPPRAPDDARTKAEIEQMKNSSVPLGDLARKYSVAELAAFLRDPLKARPSGRMPSMKLTEEESLAIAMYLLRTQRTDAAPSKLRGLACEFYAGKFEKLPDFAALKPDATVDADGFTLKAAGTKEEFAMRFRGTVKVPEEGEWTFFSNSDDGTRLFIDGSKIVENDGTHAPKERDGKVKLAVGDHALVLEYFNRHGGMELAVSWKGPGVPKKKPVPVSALSHEGMAMMPDDNQPFTIDAAKAVRGAELFTTMNCAACHTNDKQVKMSKPLAELVSARPAGCLAPAPPASAPKFVMNEHQRAQMLAQLAAMDTLAKPPAPPDEIARTMGALNCYACHQREGQGRPTGLRREYFKTNGEVDLGEEGEIPPPLNGVGAKLKRNAIARILWNAAVARPYMATRMPQFGETNVKQLPEAFEQADNAGHSPAEAAPDETMEKYGHKLVGIEGLSCVACHGFAGHPSLGVPALDLALVGERLRFDWFRRYLLDPQALRPGTRMPPFWPGGVSANAKILDGDAKKQIAAIWAYLVKGKRADIPLGLVKGKIELVADKEAIIYRNFIEGAGPRAIGVGYPEKANLAFDANEMRIAMIWQGSFIDASRHRVGRGQGFEPPLGFNIVKLAPGAPFAVLEDAATPWPAAVGKAAGYQFRGYVLDAQRRPAFRFTFVNALFEDFPIAVKGEADAGLRRTITIHGEKPVERLFFRAATGTKIEEKGGGVFLADGKVRLTFGGAAARLRQSGDEIELLVPVIFKGSEAKFTEEISW